MKAPTESEWENLRDRLIEELRLIVDAENVAHSVALLLGRLLREDGGCDHSVGICACGTIRLLDEERRARRASRRELKAWRDKLSLDPSPARE